MSHEEIAFGYLLARSVYYINKRNWYVLPIHTRYKQIFFWLFLNQSFRNGSEVWAPDDKKALRLQNSVKLGQSHRNLMALKVLNIVL